MNLLLAVAVAVVLAFHTMELAKAIVPLVEKFLECSVMFFLHALEEETREAKAVGRFGISDQLMIIPHAIGSLPYPDGGMRKNTGIPMNKLIVRTLVLILLSVTSCGNSHDTLFADYNSKLDYNIRVDLNYVIYWTGDVQSIKFTSIIPSSIGDRQNVKRILELFLFKGSLSG